MVTLVVVSELLHNINLWNFPALPIPNILSHGPQHVHKECTSVRSYNSMVDSKNAAIASLNIREMQNYKEVIAHTSQNGHYQ